MHRRNFVVRCGFAAAGTLLLPVLSPFAGQAQAASVSARSTGILTKGDRKLMNLVSAYGTDMYFWGNGVFARATGMKTNASTINLLVRVDDFLRLTTFLRSDAVKTLGVVRSVGNTLSFTYKGTAYTVTNADAASFTTAAAKGGVARARLADSDSVGAAFAHQALLYHPATDTFVDSHLALDGHQISLAETPAGGLKVRLQTVLQGWLESRRLGWELGKDFTDFQNELLESQPTGKAAHKVVSALVENIAALSAVYDVEALRPLLLSPLVSGSLLTEFGLDAETVLTQVTTLRAQLSPVDYPDAVLWLASLLQTPIKNGTEGEWFGPLTQDDAANAANRTALKGARRLIRTAVFAGG